MRLFGWFRRRPETNKALSPVPGQGGWVGLIRESFAGAWQRDIELRTDSILTYSAVFRSIALISSDIAKMRIRLVKQDANGIWQEAENPAWSPVLRKPNRYSTRIQFFKSWVESKLVHGNTYVLKQRDARNVVTALYVLHPQLITVLVAPDGAVFYELRADDLAGIRDRLVVPASEIIHDRGPTFNHPLVGVSPISACGLAATQGLQIQRSSTKFFANGSRPGGILTAPAHINDDTARRVKEMWEAKYGAGGTDFGKVAVLGDGLKYESMMMTALDAQLIDQLKMTAEEVARAFGVPGFKIDVGTAPTYNNIEALDQQYYSQCLQIHIEEIELALDEGLELPRPFGTEFDLGDLLRMDSSTRAQTAKDAIGAGAMAPNEARRRYFDLGPVEGGESPYLQIQMNSLAALARRDAQSTPAEPEPMPPSVGEEAEAKRLRLLRDATKRFHALADRETLDGYSIH